MTDPKIEKAIALQNARTSTTSYALHGLGARADDFIGRLSIAADSLAKYDARDRHLKAVAPQCRFVNKAPRRPKR